MSNKGKFTQVEITSQPEIWKQTLSQLGKINIDNWSLRNDYDQLILTGCGSTYYLSIWAARVFQRRLQKYSQALPASELWLFPEDWDLPDRSSFLLAISRSGTTSETIAGMKKIKEESKIHTGVITCYPDSDLARLGDRLLSMPSAQEESIAQTRSFTNMMLGVCLLAEGKINSWIPDKLSEIGISVMDQYRPLMKELATDEQIDRFFFLGSDQRYGLACEAMLKMKEMSLSYSEAYHFLEFRHGPMSMVNDRSLIIGLLGDKNQKFELDVLEDMKGLGGRILALGGKIQNDLPSWIDHQITLDLNKIGSFGDVLYLPCLQLLAYEKSIYKGLDPDRPANLDAVVILDE
jgi:glucosamine--fructose-6-phosphate aminotransferase (isomerizing)